MSKYNHIKDKKDPRDFKFHAASRVLKALPRIVDLRSQLPEVYSQGELGSCGLNAGAAAYQFCDKNYMPSRLQWYYDVRKLEGTIGEDAGVMLRDVMKSGVSTGVCPESMWPYTISRFTERPLGSCYLEAEKHQVEMYQSVNQTLDQMQGCLAQGYPFMAGIQIYESFDKITVERTGEVPMPKRRWLFGERLLGGHAILICGYNDFREHFIFRNSYGAEWGDKGYGYLPYEFMLDPGLTSDMWTVRIVEHP